MKIRKFQHVPQDKIDESAHELVRRLFGVEGALITNRSLLEDFEDFEDIPGHTQRQVSTLPSEDQKKCASEHPYLNRDNLPRLYVWYPLLTDEEWKQIEQKRQEAFVEHIAENYGVVIPEILAGETRVWKVAELIAEKQKHAMKQKKTRHEKQ